MQLIRHNLSLLGDHEWLDKRFWSVFAGKNISSIPKPEVLDMAQIARIEDIRICYAPLFYFNPFAKIVLIGVTPGWSQMYTALEECLAASRSSKDLDAFDTQRGHNAGYFGGILRRNLINMLDSIHLNSYLGLKSTSSLFGDDRHLVHSTSLVRYPAFKDLSNYTGHNPKISSNPLLKYMIDDIFYREIVELRDCIAVPLGRIADDCLTKISNNFNSPQIIHGFPHPSSANGHRLKQFHENFDWLRDQVNELR